MACRNCVLLLLNTTRTSLRAPLNLGTVSALLNSTTRQVIFEEGREAIYCIANYKGAVFVARFRPLQSVLQRFLSEGGLLQALTVSLVPYCTPNFLPRKFYVISIGRQVEQQLYLLLLRAFTLWWQQSLTMNWNEHFEKINISRFTKLNSNFSVVTLSNCNLLFNLESDVCLRHFQPEDHRFCDITQYAVGLCCVTLLDAVN